MNSAARSNRRLLWWFLLLLVACPVPAGIAVAAGGGRVNWSYNSLYGLSVDYLTGPGYDCDYHETTITISSANKDFVHIEQHTLCIDYFVHPHPRQTPMPKPTAASGLIP